MGRSHGHSFPHPLRPRTVLSTGGTSVPAWIHLAGAGQVPIWDTTVLSGPFHSVERSVDKDEKRTLQWANLRSSVGKQQVMASKRADASIANPSRPVDGTVDETDVWESVGE